MITCIFFSLSGREARRRALPELRPRGVVGGERQDGGGTLLRTLWVQLLRLQGALAHDPRSLPAASQLGGRLRDVKRFPFVSAISTVFMHTEPQMTIGCHLVFRGWRPERGKWPPTLCDRGTASSSSSPGKATCSRSFL